MKLKEFAVIKQRADELAVYFEKALRRFTDDQLGVMEQKANEQVSKISFEIEKNETIEGLQISRLAFNAMRMVVCVHLMERSNHEDDSLSAP